MSDNLWGVTLEDMKRAVNLKYEIHISAKKGYRFTRGSCSIWVVRKELSTVGWQTAEVDKYNLFTNHKMFDTLKEALEREW